jgi:hypothetical protein
MLSIRHVSLLVLALSATAGCSGTPEEGENAPVEPGGPAPGSGGGPASGGSALVAEGEGGETGAVGRYEIDPNAQVDKTHVFSTFRRTSDGTTQMVPRGTHICVLADVQGNFDETCPNNTCQLDIPATIFASGDNWALRRNAHTRNVGAICYRHSNFFNAPPGSFIMWADDPGSAFVSTGWPSCTHSTSIASWHGDAITFINTVLGEYEGSGERVTITQKASFQAGQSTANVRTGQCFGNVATRFGTYFVGSPGVSVPVYIGAGDARVWANAAGSEFAVGSNQTAVMARTDRAMCYLTRFSGDFNGSGERVRIFPQIVNGVERWHLQATAGSGSSAQGNARCLAFDQTQISVPGPD